MNTPSIPNRWRSVLAISIATGLTFGIGTAAAQSDSDDETIEEIVVTGIRGSLGAARDLKRNSTAIIDALVAEDIGKFPDTNLAEAMQRIPGVQLSRVAVGGQGPGEGQTVSIRGLGPQTSRVFVDGRAVQSTYFGSREIDFRDLPSNFLSAVSVVKSPLASTIEGGLAGTVEVTTARPFDQPRGFRVTALTQAVHSDLLDDMNPRGSVLISNLSDDESFGWLFGGFYQDRKTRSDTFSLNEWLCASDCSSSVPPSERQFRPRQIEQVLEFRDDDRYGGIASAQWRPSSDFELTANIFYSVRDYQDNRSAIAQRVARFDIDDVSFMSPHGSALTFTLDPGGRGVEYQANRSGAENLTSIYGLSGTYTKDRWEFSGDISFSYTEAPGISFESGDVRRAEATGPITVDLRTATGVPKQIDFGTFSGAPLTVNPDDFPTFLRLDKTFVELEDTQVRFDAIREFDGGSPLESIEMGIRYSEATMFNDVGTTQGFSFGTLEDPNFNGVPVNQLVTSVQQQFGVSDFGHGIPGQQISNWLRGDIDLLNAPNYALIMNNKSNLGERPDQENDIKEEILAAYFQANFSSGNISGNIGLRVVRDDRTVKGKIILGPVIEDAVGKYDGTEILPSANLRIDLVPDEWLLRFGASRTFFRPTYDDVRFGVSPRFGSGPPDFVGAFAQGGNQNLEPFRANNFDVSLEWYYGDINKLSFALFLKELESTPVDTSSFGPLPVISEASGIPVDTIFEIVGPVNGPPAELRGIELSWEHEFVNWVPGLGIVTSYTYIDQDTNVVSAISGVEFGLEGVSKHSYNVIGYYENESFSVRLAYNWRDDYVRRVFTTGGRQPPIADDFGSLDAQFTYRFNDRFQAIVEASNITEEDFREYNIVSERLKTYTHIGRRIYFGIRAQF